MPITEFLERNARLYPNDVSLVEINPANQPERNITWREYNLIEASESEKYRREMTWREFDVKANRFANFLFTRGIKKGDKVAILLMNCLEWLPIYFGILKTGALAVPMNYRYASDEIKYCADLADVRMLVFGPEFTERVNAVKDEMNIDDYFFVGKHDETPDYADNYAEMTYYCSTMRIMRQFISHQVQQASPRLFYILMQLLCIHVRLNRIIIHRQGMMCSSVFLLFIIQVQKCTGSEAFFQAVRLFFSEVSSPNGCFRLFRKRKPLSYGFLCPGLRIFLTQLTEAR